MNKAFILLGVFLGCNLSFADCFKDCCGSGNGGSKSVSGKKVLIEIDGRTIKMNGVEFSNKVNEQTILPVGFHGLVYEVSWDIFSDVGMIRDCHVTVETRCNGVSGVLCFCKCTNGKTYVVFSENCKPLETGENITSFFKNFVYIYFHCFDGIGNCSNLFYHCDDLETIYFYCKGEFINQFNGCKDVFFACRKLWNVFFGAEVSDDCSRELVNIYFLSCRDRNRGHFAK